jgi:hypothetical protein
MPPAIPISQFPRFFTRFRYGSHGLILANVRNGVKAYYGAGVVIALKYPPIYKVSRSSVIIDWIFPLTPEKLPSAWPWPGVGVAVGVAVGVVENVGL